MSLNSVVVRPKLSRQLSQHEIPLSFDSRLPVHDLSSSRLTHPSSWSFPRMSHAGARPLGPLVTVAMLSVGTMVYTFWPYIEQQYVM